MKTSKKPSVGVLALEAEIERYTKLLDESIASKDPLEKTKLIFHELKILTEKLAEMIIAVPQKKVRFVASESPVGSRYARPGKGGSGRQQTNDHGYSNQGMMAE